METYKFSVAKSLPGGFTTFFILRHETWNDWHMFETLYTLFFFDPDADHYVNIGPLKIGQFDMSEEQKSPDLPTLFNQLDNRFFSVANDDSYYEHLEKYDMREHVLTALNDIAFSEDILGLALNEQVTSESLLRSNSRETVSTQFRRMALGGLRLVKFHFDYTTPSGVQFEFYVDPESEPSTNIHVLIGKNGVGKTTLLRQMTIAFVNDDSTYGRFTFESSRNEQKGKLANLVSVSFSAFDKFAPLKNRKVQSLRPAYAYVGLKVQEDDTIAASPLDRAIALDIDSIAIPEQENEQVTLKNLAQLADEFIESVDVCRQGIRRVRWLNCLKRLEYDQLFQAARLTKMNLDDDAFLTDCRKLFTGLSSGHQCVLLTITKLVETVNERSLVLFDEPELHLHPPLLAAFIGALSDLLVDRNGAAIIATHSPVVLQEVPKECVSIVTRSGKQLKIDRPRIETFGENVGILTHEVFGLEIKESGFYKLIAEKAEELREYRSVLRKFGSLGGEGKALLQAAIARLNREEEEGN